MSREIWTVKEGEDKLKKQEKIQKSFLLMKRLDSIKDELTSIEFDEDVSFRKASFKRVNDKINEIKVVLDSLESRLLKKYWKYEEVRNKIKKGGKRWAK